MIRLFYEDIKDTLIRDTFRRVSEFLNGSDILKGNFKFQTYTFAAAATNLRIPHGFSGIPRDVIVSSVTNDETVTFHFSEFDADELELSATGACTVRFFIGTYTGGSNV